MLSHTAFSASDIRNASGRHRLYMRTTALASVALLALTLAASPSWARGGGEGNDYGEDSATGPGEDATYGGGGGAGTTGGAGSSNGFNGGSVTGGAGGASPGASGGNGVINSGIGAAGGGGGAHGYVGTSLPTGDAAGGNGGNGATSGDYSLSFLGGGGGAGGWGAVITSQITNGIVNHNITGGNGGNGGPASGNVSQGYGGTGGTGLWLTSGSSLTINAAVTGGNGGTGSTPYGASGTGLVGHDISITIGASGSVTAGGYGTNNAGNAFEFSGMSSLYIQNAAGVQGRIQNSGSLMIVQDTGSLTLDNEFYGSGDLLTGGSGTLVFTGTSTYTGNTTVGGTLLVNGSIASSAMTNVIGGTLGGSGTVGSLSIQGGILSPGNSIGTLSVSGSLSLTSASTYMVEISPTDADRVNVTGTATLGGATLNLTFEPGTYVQRQYTILNATGGISGTFGDVVTTGAPGTLNTAVSYDANKVFVNLSMNVTPGTYTAPNQIGVANAIADYFQRTGQLPSEFTQLDGQGMSQVAGELGTGIQNVNTNANTQFVNTMMDPSNSNRTGPAAPLSYAATRAPTDAFASLDPVRDSYNRWSVWASAFGGTSAIASNASAGTAKTTSNAGGFAVGADYHFSADTVAGFAMGGATTSYSVAGNGSGRSDMFQLGAFARHNLGNAYISGAAVYGWQDVSTERSLAISCINRLTANYNANSYLVRVEGGKRFAVPAFGNAGLTPYAAAQLNMLSLPGYSEKGTGVFALTYAGKTVTDPRTELGLRTDASYQTAYGQMTLSSRAAWAYNYSPAHSTQAMFQSLPGSSFIVQGAERSRNAALTSASVELGFTNGITLSTTFEGEFSNTVTSYIGKGTVRYAW